MSCVSFSGDKDFTAQPRFVYHHIFWEDIYQFVKENHAFGLLFLLRLYHDNEEVHRPLSGEKGEGIRKNETQLEYKPFVVFEQGKDNPYWDDHLLRKLTLELLRRFRMEYEKVETITIKPDDLVETAPCELDEKSISSKTGLENTLKLILKYLEDIIRTIDGDEDLLSLLKDLTLKVKNTFYISL